MDAKQHRNLPSQEQLHQEMVEVLDEELELELDDTRLAELLKNVTGIETQETLDRHTYFKELLRLQKELVKLQDWVAHQKLKVVVLFEGRDAAGKGGVIKRIDAAAQSAHLQGRGAAGAERARTHAMVFPALCRASAGRRRDRAVRPQLVQPRRRRAGDGISAPRTSARSSSAPCRNSSACWCAPASFWSNTGSRSPTKSRICAS